jgi:DNA-binding GntR family transcriptional regulator
LTKNILSDIHIIYSRCIGCILLKGDNKLQTKKDIAYKYIKKGIIEGSVFENPILSISYFARKLKMSRSPIRDAIQKLQAEGFLKIVANRGIFIQELTASETIQIYELRMAIESYLLKKVVNIITKNDIKNLRKILEDQKTSCRNKDIYSFMKFDNELHMYFHRIYYNKMLCDIISRMRDRIFYAGLQALKVSYRMLESFKEHTDIIDALEKGDTEKACHALEYHLQRGLSSATTIFSSTNINLSKREDLIMCK